MTEEDVVVDVNVMLLGVLGVQGFEISLNNFCSTYLGSFFKLTVDSLLGSGPLDLLKLLLLGEFLALLILFIPVPAPLKAIVATLVLSVVGESVSFNCGLLPKPCLNLILTEQRPVRIVFRQVGNPLSIEPFEGGTYLLE